MPTMSATTLGTLPLVEGPVDGAEGLEVTLHEQALAWKLSAALVREEIHPAFALALLDAWPALPSPG